MHVRMCLWFRLHVLSLFHRTRSPRIRMRCHRKPDATKTDLAGCRTSVLREKHGGSTSKECSVAEPSRRLKALSTGLALARARHIRRHRRLTHDPSAEATLPRHVTTSQNNALSCTNRARRVLTSSRQRLRCFAAPAVQRGMRPNFSQQPPYTTVHDFHRS